MEEEEFWQNELQIEVESERQLRQQLAELQGGVRDCEAKLSEYLARIQVSLASQRSYRIPRVAVSLFQHEHLKTSSGNWSSKL